MKNKELHKHINDWRVFPRIFSLFYLYLMYKVVSITWTIPIDQLTAQFAGILASIVGAGAAWFKFYVTSGNKD